MLEFNMIVAAVLPAVVLIYYIYRRDTIKEPTGQLLKGFGLGALSGLIASVLEALLGIIGLADFEPQSFLSAVNTAFIGAALPEELAKLAMLFVLIHRNPWFDEWMDGVVYAVSIGMGFAAIENITYIFGYADQWQSIALMRSITSVPAHFAFAVLMGFFFSLVRIGGRHTQRDRLLVLGAPILAHGTYDALLFAADTVPEWMSLVFTILFIVLLVKLVSICRSYIRRLRAFDSIPKPFSNP